MNVFFFGEREPDAVGSLCEPFYHLSTSVPANHLPLIAVYPASQPDTTAQSLGGKKERGRQGTQSLRCPPSQSPYPPPSRYDETRP